jgi:hypothetical protein
VRKATSSLIVFVLAALSGVSFGSANLAQAPKILRQTYYDGSFTEVECDPPSESRRVNCEFRVGHKRHISAYSFSLYDFGYDPFLVVPTYNYWPNGGKFPFNVIFQVECLDADLQLIPNANPDNAECNIYLSPCGKHLVAERTAISAIINGHYSRADRSINDPVQP